MLRPRIGTGARVDFGIRRAIAADWPAVRRVHEGAVPFELHFINEADRPRMATLEHVFRGDLWVAEAMAKVMGFVACVGTDISWLYVDPQHFRRGVARALLRHAVAHCGSIANASILADNEACLSLMASEGFVTAARETVTIPGYGEARVHKVRRVRLYNDRHVSSGTAMLFV
jgi:ribosomal protein S18 acetylase RimI-like enzyme